MNKRQRKKRGESNLVPGVNSFVRFFTFYLDLVPLWLTCWLSNCCGVWTRTQIGIFQPQIKSSICIKQRIRDPMACPQLSSPEQQQVTARLIIHLMHHHPLRCTTCNPSGSYEPPPSKLDIHSWNSSTTINHNLFFPTILFLCSTAESCLPSKPRLLLPLWLMGMMPWVRSICLGRKRRAQRPMAHHSCRCTVCFTEKPLMKCSRSAAYHQKAIGTAWCQPSSAWWDIHTQLQNKPLIEPMLVNQ